MRVVADELNRDALALVTHDLRGVASALALRAELLASLLSPRDLAAFKSLSTELLEIDTTLQLMQTGRPGNAKSGNTVGSGEWWKITSRLSSGGLPRGSRQTAEIASLEMELRQASLLTHAWRVACRGIGSCSGGTPIHIELDLAAVNSGGVPCGISMIARAHSAAFSGEREVDKIATAISGIRWARYAKRRAKENRATLNWWSKIETGFEWGCEV